jgi:hypothetical protein
MIVSETDPQYLSDNVTDLVPPKAEVSVDTPEVKADAPKEKEPEAPVAQNVIADQGKGLTVPFKGLSISIPGVDVRNAKQVDWNTAKGVAYTFEKGNLANATLQFKGASIIKVMQRYQTVALVKTAKGKNLKLNSIPTYSSEWQALKGNANTFAIAGINEKDLKFDQKFSLQAAKNAVQKSARDNKVNRKEEDELLNSVNKSRSYNQEPLSVALKSITWKITAKDATGKTFEKELRIDYDR